MSEGDSCPDGVNQPLDAPGSPGQSRDAPGGSGMALLGGLGAGTASAVSTGGAGCLLLCPRAKR